MLDIKEFEICKRKCLFLLGDWKMNQRRVIKVKKQTNMTELKTNMNENKHE